MSVFFTVQELLRLHPKRCKEKSYRLVKFFLMCYPIFVPFLKAYQVKYALWYIIFDTMAKREVLLWTAVTSA